MRKKILAVVLSLTIAVAFMPVMAFADVAYEYNKGDVVWTADWADDYSSVTVTKGTFKEATDDLDDAVWEKGVTYSTVRTWNAGGYITATVPKDETIGGNGYEWYTASDDKWVYGSVNPKTGKGASYYDLSGVKFVKKGTDKEFTPVYASLDAFENQKDDSTTPAKYLVIYNDETGKTTLDIDVAKALWATTVDVKNYAPAYVENYNAETMVLTLTPDMLEQAVSGKAIGFVTDGYNPKSYDAQSFTFKSVINKTNSITPGWVNAFIGSFELNVAINASSEAPVVAKDAEFYVDEVKGNPMKMGSGQADINPVTYDGAEHEIIMDGEGLEVAWTMQYDDEDAVAVDKAVFENVGKYVFTATVTDAAGHKVTRTIRVEVEAPAAPTFGFEKNDKTGLYEFKVDYEYDPISYVEISTTAVAEGKKALEANRELLMDYFKDFYVIETEAKKFAPEEETATIKLDSDKLDSLTKEEKKALVEKYGEMLANFGKDARDITTDVLGLTATEWEKEYKGYYPWGEWVDVPVAWADTALFLIQDPEHVVYDDEIEFTKAPSKKTYHVKKAKALKKAKKFTVKAEALSGYAPMYKLINANSKIKINKETGKITVKKGLKKGTYKIKVKAYTFESYDYLAASETQAITIKVAK